MRSVTRLRLMPTSTWGAFGPFEALHYAFVSDPYTGHHLTVYLHDAVSRYDAQSLNSVLPQWWKRP